MLHLLLIRAVFSSVPTRGSYGGKLSLISEQSDNFLKELQFYKRAPTITTKKCNHKEATSEIQRISSFLYIYKMMFVSKAINKEIRTLIDVICCPV